VEGESRVAMLVSQQRSFASAMRGVTAQALFLVCAVCGVEKRHPEPTAYHGGRQVRTGTRRKGGAELIGAYGAR